MEQSKRGTKWTPAEHEQFINLVNENKTKEEIAEILGRSTLSIEFRLKTYAAELHQQGSPISHIISVTNLGEEEILAIAKEKDISQAAMRKGQRWTEEEVIALLQAIRRKKSHADIAIKTQRTVISVVAKLESLAYDYYHTGKKMVDEISTLTGLDRDVIEKIIAKSKKGNKKTNEIILNPE